LHAHTLPYKPLLIGGPGIACLRSKPLEEALEQFLSQAINSLDMILTSATAYIKNDAVQLSYLGYILALPLHTEYFFRLWMGDEQ
jgi:hypothetical protein